ncbi:MAG: hypothetical protein IJS50_06170 [Desulfovibrio sp.]|nr:hypothetical protein [Desulfovibrio sp.]
MAMTPFGWQGLRPILAVITIALLFFLSSCVHSHGKEPSNVEVLAEENFKTLDKFNHGRSIFVSVEGTLQGQSVAREIAYQLQKHGFKRSRSPSSADLILQLTIAYAGQMDPARLERAVKAGYDQRVAAKGEGLSCVIFDALLVAREVPSDKNDVKKKLQSISQRQARYSSTMRLSLATEGNYSLRQLPRIFSETLAKVISAKVLKACHK